MRQMQWLNSTRHWIGRTLHWDAVKAAMHDALAEDAEPEWVIAYETAGGFCCLYEDRALDFASIDDVRAWTRGADVRVYFIGL